MNIRYRDYIPTRNADFNRWFINLVEYVDAKMPEQGQQSWTHIPRQDFVRLVQALEDWAVNYAPTLVPSTHPQRVARDEARKRAVAVIRPFVQRFLMYPPVTDTERAEMELHIRDRTPSREPIPVHLVLIQAITSIICQLTFRFTVEGIGHSTARPEHVHMVQFRWVKSKTRPNHIDELVNFETHSTGPITLTFQEDERGDRVHFTARWLNRRGEGGPWCDIESAIIP